MAVAQRDRKKGTVYRVATKWKGKIYFEDAGMDRREARRLDDRRKREVKAGTYTPSAARSGGISVGSYAERFFAERTNRNAGSEQTQVELHALAISWFAEMSREDVRPPHFLEVVKELRKKIRIVRGVEKRALTEKSIANIMGTIRTMFGDAHFKEVIPSNPYVLPRKTLKRKSKPRPAYRGSEVLALLSDKVELSRRCFLCIAFSPACGKARSAGGAFAIGSAMHGRWVRYFAPGSTTISRSRATTMRRAATRGRAWSRVHPELERVLEWWWTEGWELVYCRKPSEDEFIVPSRQIPEKNLTRSGGYKLLASVEDAPSDDWSEAWLAECDARVAAAQGGTEPAAAWDDVYGRLRARLGQQ